MKLTQWICRTLTATLILTSTSAFACRLGEVRAFKDSEYSRCPQNQRCKDELSDWIPAKGQLLSIRDYSDIYALYGSYFGGDNKFTFGVPRIPDLTVQGKSYPFYVCNKGSWFADENKDNASFIEQHAKMSQNLENDLIMDSNKHVFTDIVFGSMTDLYMPEFCENESTDLEVPTFNNGQLIVLNGRNEVPFLVSRLINYPVFQGAPNEYATCDEGGIYFSIMNPKYTPKNMKELKDHIIVASGQNGQKPVRVFLCEDPRNY